MDWWCRWLFSGDGRVLVQPVPEWRGRLSDETCCLSCSSWQQVGWVHFSNVSFTRTRVLLLCYITALTGGSCLMTSLPFNNEEWMESHSWWCFTSCDELVLHKIKISRLMCVTTADLLENPLRFNCCQFFLFVCLFVFLVVSLYTWAMQKQQSGKTWNPCQLMGG